MYKSKKNGSGGYPANSGKGYLYGEERKEGDAAAGDWRSAWAVKKDFLNIVCQVPFLTERKKVLQVTII